MSAALDMTTEAPRAKPHRAISLETVGMTKIFGSLTALDDVSIKVHAGTLHALLGENGAGKSTLVKCIMGFYQPTRGQVMIDGHEVEIHNPRDAHAHGIGMVYQHFTLVPSLTAAENLVISRAHPPAVIDWRDGDARRSTNSSTACRSRCRSTCRFSACRRARSRSSKSSSSSISTSTS